MNPNNSPAPVPRLGFPDLANPKQPGRDVVRLSRPVVTVRAEAGVL